MAVLLAAFVATARGGLRSAGPVDATSTFACELTPPRDIDGLERCLAVNQRDVELMLDLGSAYEAQGDPERAETIYRRALSVDSKDADLHVRLAQVLLRRGEHGEAAHEAHVALTLQPGSSRALALLAHAGGQGHQ
jgi:cytochrome c-type biogenesis protein CcmH/NrfG